MSCNPTTIADSHTPSEILCKFLIKAELPKSLLLDELQETYLSSLVEKENIFSPANGQEQLSQQSDDWKLYGSFLIEQVSSEIKEEEEEVEIELYQETFIGSLDHLGNGLGKIDNYIIPISYIYI